jgi:crotonobetainyl-CoA:carnitine CoA-transferase CaiB-like acyl-CoA transferase
VSGTACEYPGGGPLLPLADVRILAVEQYGAGPFGTVQLADLGADVVKIEDPSSRGDVGRYVPPYQAGEDSLFFETLNRGKRSLSLDLRMPAGRRVFEDLIPNVDAVFSNLRGDQVDRLRLRYADLAPRNRRIVCCSLSGFGNTGPRAVEPAYDYVVQAMTGWMSITGEPDGPPTKTGLSLVDFAGGYVAMIALMAGLWRARRDGEGCDCDVSLYESALALLTYVGTWAATANHEPQRIAESAHPSIVPFQAFQTADGWITVACAKEKFWLALCDALALDELPKDPRFATFAARHKHRGELLAVLRPIFRSFDTSAAVARLSEAGVPVGRVNTVNEALRDPQVEARGDVISYTHPHFGEVTEIASPLRLTGPRLSYTRAPRRGEHTEAVARDLCGYSTDEIARLREQGAFGTTGSADPAIRVGKGG